MSQCGSSSCAFRIVYAVSITIGCSVLPLTLRARIEGAVMRFPGTGEGVARLVLVSIVKVDMARPSNGLTLPPPVEARYAPVTQGTRHLRQTSSDQVREAIGLSRVTMET